MNAQQFIIFSHKLQIKLLALFSKKMAGQKAFSLFCTPFGKRTYTNTKMPGAAHSLSILFNHRKMKGYAWNMKADKKVLIVHGFRSSVQRFEHFVEPLLKHGFGVIAFDAPAHGLSKGKKITALDYKDFILRLNANFGPFHSYIAHSLGATSLTFALAELPPSEQGKAVLIAPAVTLDFQIKQFFSHLQIHDAGVQEAFYNAIRQLTRYPIDWFSIQRCLPYIHSHILWLHDKTDKITSFKDAQKLHDNKYPNIHFYFTKGLGHSRIYQANTVVDKIIQFIISSEYF